MHAFRLVKNVVKFRALRSSGTVCSQVSLVVSEPVSTIPAQSTFEIFTKITTTDELVCIVFTRVYRFISRLPTTYTTLKQNVRRRVRKTVVVARTRAFRYTIQ